MRVGPVGDVAGMLIGGILLTSRHHRSRPVDARNPNRSGWPATMAAAASLTRRASAGLACLLDNPVRQKVTVHVDKGRRVG